jgi:hypothetical protein
MPKYSYVDLPEEGEPAPKEVAPQPAPPKQEIPRRRKALRIEEDDEPEYEAPPRRSFVLPFREPEPEPKKKRKKRSTKKEVVPQRRPNFIENISTTTLVVLFGFLAGSFYLLKN